jgi:Rieske Fe-S protein
MSHLNRRNFLKDTCKACLVGAMSLSVVDLLESCSTIKSYKATMAGNQVEVPLTLFDKATLQVISPRNYAYEIAVKKQPDNNYEALLLRCTHQHNPLTPTGNGYVCTVHGSQFDKDGKVKKGPAAASLPQLRTEVREANLIIHV